MARILLLSNIPTPYQLDFWQQMSTKTDVRAVFLWDKVANHEWNVAHPSWLHILNYTDKTSGWAALQTILDDFKPDVLVVGGYRLPLANHAKKYAFRRKLRFFYWLEKPLPSSSIKRLLRTVAWCLALPFAHGILCIGSQAQQCYARFNRRTLNLPYAIDLNRYALRSQTPAQAPLRCLFVGQYIPRKGVAELLDAFAAIAPSDASLTLAGSGELKPLIADYAQRHTHIHDHGFVEPHSLPQLFAEHDLFILPSRHDGWAVVVAEALAAGLPVIGTRHTSAFVDLVQPHGCGMACEVDAASIRSAVEYYIAHPEHVRAQGAAGRQALAASPAIAENAAHRLLAWLG